MALPVRPAVPEKGLADLGRRRDILIPEKLPMIRI